LPRSFGPDDDLDKNSDFAAICCSIHITVVTLTSSMEADRCRTLLVEAAMLISATRACIARSVTLLAQLSLDGARRPASEWAKPLRAARRSSSHPPSSPPS
jgi:hypothetical protein